MEANSVSEVLAIAAHAHPVPAAVSDLTIDLHFPAVMEALLKETNADGSMLIREAVRLK